MGTAPDQTQAQQVSTKGSILDKQTDDTKYEFEHPPRPWWKGNINIHILLAITVLVWFIFGRGPRYYSLYNSASTWGLVHVIAAGTFGCICCVNVFHTPSHGAIYRTVHIVLGRLAIIASVVALAAGLVVIFHERPFGDQSIGLMVAATVQTFFHALGMYALYKPTRSLSLHAVSMHSLLLGACFSPALQRLPDMLGVSFGASWPLYSWSFAIILIFFSTHALKRKSFW